jgi:hypothetical protein
MKDLHFQWYKDDKETGGIWTELIGDDIRLGWEFEKEQRNNGLFLVIISRNNREEDIYYSLEFPKEYNIDAVKELLESI